MKTLKLFKATFSPSINDLKAIKDELVNLQTEMKKISEMENKVEAIVRLFQVISPIQDKGGFSQTIFKLKEKNYGQIDEIISALGVLQTHFNNAGRSQHGINRTTVGEEVTAAKVFLGNIFGIWTLPASYCLEKREELEKTIRKDVSRDPEKPVTEWYLINEYQAGSFVKTHTEGILVELEILMKKVA